MTYKPLTPAEIVQGMSDAIHPPRGFCIGIFYGTGGTMVGPFATEDEARQALANAQIVVVGHPAGWQNWCGSTNGALVCQKPTGHERGEEPDIWHDNGAVAWPAELICGVCKANHSESGRMDPEICKAHHDAQCPSCDTQIDDLWVHPRDIEL